MIFLPFCDCFLSVLHLVISLYGFFAVPYIVFVAFFAEMLYNKRNAE